MVEEDWVGPHGQSAGEEYVFCARCGRALPAGETVLVSDEVVDFPTSEERPQICLECQSDLRDLSPEL